jgi:hypothetical protein
MIKAPIINHAQLYAHSWAEPRIEETSYRTGCASIVHKDAGIPIDKSILWKVANLKSKTCSLKIYFSFSEPFCVNLVSSFQKELNLDQQLFFGKLNSEGVPNAEFCVNFQNKVAKTFTQKSYKPKNYINNNTMERLDISLLFYKHFFN